MSDFDDKKPAAKSHPNAVDIAAEEDSTQEEDNNTSAQDQLQQLQQQQQQQQQQSHVQPQQYHDQQHQVQPALQQQQVQGPTSPPHTAPTHQTGSIATWCNSEAYVSQDEDNMASIDQDMIMDMLRTTYTIGHADGDVRHQLAQGYDISPPDPGFFLARTTNHQLIILYGIKVCTQVGSAWCQQTVGFAGDIPTNSQLPATWSTKHLNTMAKMVQVSAVVNLTKLRASVKANPQQPTLVPTFPTNKTPQKLPVVSMVKIPAPLLARALAAGDPQTAPLPFLLVIAEFLHQHSKTESKLPSTGFNTPKTMQVLKNSLFALASSITGRKDNVITDTGVAEMELALDTLSHQPPDHKSTLWVQRNFQTIQPLAATLKAPPPTTTHHVSFAANSAPTGLPAQAPGVHSTINHAISGFSGPGLPPAQAPGVHSTINHGISGFPGSGLPPAQAPGVHSTINHATAGFLGLPPAQAPGVHNTINHAMSGFPGPGHPPAQAPGVHSTFNHATAGFPGPAFGGPTPTSPATPSGLPPPAQAPGVHSTSHTATSGFPGPLVGAPNSINPAPSGFPGPAFGTPNTTTPAPSGFPGSAPGAPSLVNPASSGLPGPTFGAASNINPAPPGFPGPASGAPSNTNSAPAFGFPGPPVGAPGTNNPAPFGLPGQPFGTPNLGQGFHPHSGFHFSGAHPAPWTPAHGPPSMFPTVDTAPRAQTSKDSAFWHFSMPCFSGWMGFPTMFPNPLESGMPRFLPMLAKLPAGSAELNSCFQNGISQLSGTLENRQNFQSFNWSPSLKKELNTMSFNLDDLQADWHKGLGPGIAMSRDRDAVTRSKRLHSEIDEYGGLGFNLGRLDTQRLQTPTPSVPKDYASFLQFLVRYSLILREWMTQNCNLYQITWALYLEILATNQNASYPEQWYQRHGPFIIWKLITPSSAQSNSLATPNNMNTPIRVWTYSRSTKVCSGIMSRMHQLGAVEESPFQLCR
ncbi:expressed unknown protein [Seminavis robusta]|uniref:Uncharacterized protein n=1 Tax=Seminavis robusta TaxID=568900 RepID=A0A9N8I1I6_9STRA|nr:expressed unknown protein [Seminavis robusta]|eukprot:Sro3687_g350290.1 n/a (974) ;mRNA; r:490-3485